MRDILQLIEISKKRMLEEGADVIRVSENVKERLEDGEFVMVLDDDNEPIFVRSVDGLYGEGGLFPSLEKASNLLSFLQHSLERDLRHSLTESEYEGLEYLFDCIYELITANEPRV